jgi:non-lysosomal glucosylceramidase
MMKFTYEGNKTREISFPLGGIGTGSVGLAGNGRLIDWEIFNHPNKGSVNGFTHLAVKAESNGKVLDARALQGDMAPPYTGSYSNTHFSSYGFGPNRETLIGMPHFREAKFEAQFPFGSVRFGGEKFPGQAGLQAFSPFIPLNDLDSTLPVAFFEVEFANDQDIPIRYSACFSLCNPLPKGKTVNTYHQADGLHMLHMTSPGMSADESGFGDMTLATDAADVSYQEYWYRGAWFDNLGIFWRDFTTFGPLKNRQYEQTGVGNTENPYFNADVGSLCASTLVDPGCKGKVRFTLAWNFPNYTNTWNPQKGTDCCSGGQGCCDEPVNSWKNYYATLFDDSLASTLYAFRNWQRLEDDSRLFAEALHGSSLPVAALDAVTANLATLKSPTCLRLTDGSFYGFEGCHCDQGCCEGSCTHVWNYAYALPYLFPALERSMHDLDFQYNSGSNGGMTFRLQLPVGRKRSSFRACADGQFGNVIKAYRDWKICGDDVWLRKNWLTIKRSIDYAWHPENTDRWDPGKTGVLTGRQHHTLDMELFGANSWLSGFYLAALKAGAEMAEAMQEPDRAREYRTIFNKGKAWVDRELFNGAYYMQKIDLKDKNLLDPYANDPHVFTSYWNDESNELKYQIGNGCAIDQVVAQWHANLCGLGEIFDPEQTRSALRSIYHHNYKRNMRDFFNPCRIFATQDEGGVTICEWPDLDEKPRVPITYAEECMNGFEYQAAIHMIQSGMVDEGMEIIAAIRHRYDGERRNPWNEFECGSNYARSMASYALLPAFSGFACDMTRGYLAFAPLVDDFSGFWSLASGWGLFKQSGSGASLSVLYGKLELREISLPKLDERDVTLTVAGNPVSCFRRGASLVFDVPLCMSTGQTLEIASQMPGL